MKSLCDLFRVFRGAVAAEYEVLNRDRIWDRAFLNSREISVPNLTWECPAPSDQIGERFGSAGNDSLCCPSSSGVYNSISS